MLWCWEANFRHLCRVTFPEEPDSKKRKHDEEEPKEAKQELLVEPFVVPNRGPYPFNQPKKWAIDIFPFRLIFFDFFQKRRWGILAEWLKRESLNSEILSSKFLSEDNLLAKSQLLDLNSSC